MTPEEIKNKIAAVEIALVFTKNDCSDCESTISFMDSKSAAYETINIDEHPEARGVLKSLRYRGAPVVFTPDDNWSGFNPEAISDYVDGVSIW